MADPPFTSLCQFASAHGNKLYRQVPTHSPVCEQRLGIATPTLRQPSAKSGAAQARDRGQDGKEGKADWGASADGGAGGAGGAGGGGRWRDARCGTVVSSLRQTPDPKEAELFGCRCHLGDTSGHELPCSLMTCWRLHRPGPCPSCHRSHELIFCPRLHDGTFHKPS